MTDFYVEGNQPPEFTALEDGEFFTSYGDGSTAGPDPAFDGIQLASAKYAGFDSWLGRDAAGGVSLRIGTAPGEASEWSGGSGGGTQWANTAVTKSAGLFVKTHFVAGGYLHASLRIVPKNQDRWKNQAPFNVVHNPPAPYDRPAPIDGKAWITIGAGSGAADTSSTCSGTLTSNFNRSGDIGDPIHRFERLSYVAEMEDYFIERLIAANRNYDDDLPYACFPENGDPYYNSNSYIAGILEATRLGAPRFVTQIWKSLPGWLKPVPKNKFDY
jgi:hypothetical protein